MHERMATAGTVEGVPQRGSGEAAPSGWQGSDLGRTRKGFARPEASLKSESARSAPRNGVKAAEERHHDGQSPRLFGGTTGLAGMHNNENGARPSALNWWQPFLFTGTCGE